MEDNKEFLKFINQSIDFVKHQKSEMGKILSPFFDELSDEVKEDKRKRNELIDLVKFIKVSQLDITIVETLEAPDFIILWNGVKYAVEHTEVIDTDKKSDFEKNKKFIKLIEDKYKLLYPEIKLFANSYIKHQIVPLNSKEKKSLTASLEKNYSSLMERLDNVFGLVYPGKLSKDDMEKEALKICNAINDVYSNGGCNYSDELVSFNFYKSEETKFKLSGGYSVGCIADLVIDKIKKKEDNLERYRMNTDLPQCLFLVVSGCFDYSDYSFLNLEKISSYKTNYDKILLLNFFKNDFFVIK